MVDSIFRQKHNENQPQIRPEISNNSNCVQTDCCNIDRNDAPLQKSRTCRVLEYKSKNEDSSEHSDKQILPGKCKCFLTKVKPIFMIH